MTISFIIQTQLEKTVKIKFTNPISSMMVSWLAITSRELNWMLTIFSSSSLLGDTSITSMEMRAAGSKISVGRTGMGFVWHRVEYLTWEHRHVVVDPTKTKAYK